MIQLTDTVRLEREGGLPGTGDGDRYQNWFIAGWAARAGGDEARAVRAFDEGLARVDRDLAGSVTALYDGACFLALAGRVDEASTLLERIADLKGDPVAELLQLGELRMSVGDTPAAIRAYERARTLQGPEFDHDLELGVLYLANRQLDDAALSLDRVSPAHPAYPLALFKRAQVSVLLGEPDREARIQLARDHADDVTIPLIAAEKLFQ